VSSSNDVKNSESNLITESEEINGIPTKWEYIYFCAIGLFIIFLIFGIPILVLPSVIVAFTLILLPVTLLALPVYYFIKRSMASKVRSIKSSDKQLKPKINLP